MPPALRLGAHAAADYHPLPARVTLAILAGWADLNRLVMAGSILCLLKHRSCPILVANVPQQTLFESYSLVTSCSDRGRPRLWQKDVGYIAFAQHDVEALHILHHLRKLLLVLLGLLMQFLRYRLLLRGRREI